MQGEFFKIETVEKIAKLQRENKRLKENCDETLINHLRKRVRDLEIVNEEHRLLNGMLREENERLREENKHIFANVNDDQLLRSNAMNYAELQDYKTRNEKAIEYINKHKELLHHSFDEPDCDYWLTTNPDNLLNILQGSDE